MPPRNSETDEDYHRRREDTMILELTKLQQKVYALEENVTSLTELLTELAKGCQQDKQEKAIQEALYAARVEQERAHRDLLAKIGAVTLSLLSILLGAWVSYAVPVYMSKH